MRGGGGTRKGAKCHHQALSQLGGSRGQKKKKSMSKRLQESEGGGRLRGIEKKLELKASMNAVRVELNQFRTKVSQP